MNYADRVEETTTITSTASITLGGAVAGFRTFASALTVGAVDIPVCVADAGANWEIGLYTLTNATTLTRQSIKSSSNGNAAVTFPAGSKNVFATLSAAQLATFATAIDAITTGVINATTSTLLIEESGITKRITMANFLAALGSSAAGLAAAGTLAGADVITVTQDGINEVKTTLATVAAYVASTLSTAASAITLVGPTAGVVSVASTSFTVGANGAITGTIIVTPSDSAAGGTFTPATVSISSGAPTGTFTYTPNATAGTKSISVTNNSTLTNPSAIAYTASAAGATINVTTPAAQTAGTAFTLAGTYTAGPPAALDYSLDGGTTWVAATTPTISGGNYSFSLTMTTANASQVVNVRDHTATTVIGTSAAFAVAAAGTTYTITPYTAGQGILATIDASAATIYAPLKQIPNSKQQVSANIYWTISPVPASASSGWGTSATVPPAATTSNVSSGTSTNGLTAMSKPGAFENDNNLWVTSGSGNGGSALWYFWIKPVDGVAQCMNPSGTTVTGA